MTDKISTSSMKLRNAAPDAKIYVLKCNKDLCAKSKIRWHRDDIHNWLLRLQCMNCHSEWSVCSTCYNFQVELRSKRQLNMHKNTYHRSKVNDSPNNDTIIAKTKKRKHINDQIDDYINNINKDKNKKKNNTDNLSENDSVHKSNGNNDYDVCDYSVADGMSEHNSMDSVNMKTSKAHTNGK